MQIGHGELAQADVSYNSDNYLIIRKWEQHNGTNRQSGFLQSLAHIGVVDDFVVILLHFATLSICHCSWVVMEHHCSVTYL